jgi:hypothetical protein
MPLTNPFAVVQRAVRLGLAPDSARRQLARMGFGNATALNRELYPKAVNMFANQSFLETESSTFTPSREIGMIETEFKEPWRNRYVMKIDFVDPTTGQLGSTNISISSNSEYSIGRAEREALREAERMAEEEGESDVTGGSTITGVSIVNAFANV